jgi:uncharacterized protein
MRTDLEEKMRELVLGESAEAALYEWANFFSGLKVPPWNYRGDHVAEAVAIAKQLAKETSANMEVVVMATWLHDCASMNTAGTPRPAGSTHPEACANKAREFLSGEEVDEAIINQVCDAIRQHGGYTRKDPETPLEPLEAQIVWEADKLTKLGLTSIIRQILNGIRYEPNPSMKEILQRVQEWMAFIHEVAACMVTAPARRMATQRIQNYEEFITRLERELFFE